MKQKKKSFRLADSSRVLESSSGEIDEKVLEGLLYSIFNENIKDSALIILSREKRVRNFNPENPEWEIVEFKRRVAYLKKLYRDTEGRDYVKPTLEQMESDYQSQSRRASFYK